MLLGFRILAAVILYTFLGVAFYIIWRDLKTTAIQAQHQAGPNHRLRVIDPNGDSSLVANQTLCLQPITWLGRDPENVIVLEHTSVSDRHACLHWENGVWWIEDLNSLNGTTLNESSLAQAMPLSHGDIIGIGDLRFRFETTGQ